MNVLFITRSTIFSNKGGDTVQLINTTRRLEELGVRTEIKLCNEKIDYRHYDLIHFFNIIRPADILRHIKNSGKPYVVSTIYVDYSEFDKTVRSGLSGFLFKLLPSDFIEFAKVIARAIINGEKIVSPEFFWLGQRNAIKKIINGASLLLPNSDSEYNRLKHHYKIAKPYRKIPNAIDSNLFQLENGTTNRIDNVVLCVGRIEGLKNQINLIRALNNTKYQLYIIGKPATNQNKYYNECRNLAASNVHFIDALDQKQLISYYATAKVHILPSWFETTGLSSLEAAAMGCNIVITDKGDTREYFEDMAFYCDPASPQSIREAVDKAAQQNSNEALKIKISTEYTWQIAALKTKEAYNEVLSK